MEPSASAVEYAVADDDDGWASAVEDSPEPEPPVLEPATGGSEDGGIFKFQSEPETDVSAPETEAPAGAAEIEEPAVEATIEKPAEIEELEDGVDPYMSRPPTSAPKVIENEGSTMSIQADMGFDCLTPCLDFWAKDASTSAESIFDPARGRSLVQAMLGDSDPVCDKTSPTSDYHLCDFFTLYSNKDGRCSNIMDQASCSVSETHALLAIESFCSSREDASEALAAVTCEGGESSFEELQVMSGDDEAIVEEARVSERLDCVAGCNLLYMVDHPGSTDMYSDCNYYHQYLFGDACGGMGVPNADMCPGTEYTALKFVDTWCNIHNTASNLNSILAPVVGSESALGCLSPCFEYFKTDIARQHHEVQDPCSHLASFIEEYAPQDTGKCAQAGISSKCSEQSVAGTYALVESTLNTVCGDMGFDASASATTVFKIAPISADHLAKAKVGEVFDKYGQSDGKSVSGVDDDGEGGEATHEASAAPATGAAHAGEGSNNETPEDEGSGGSHMSIITIVLVLLTIVVMGVLFVQARNSGGGSAFTWADPGAGSVLAGSNVSIL
jgi:hypothetical protein